MDTKGMILTWLFFFTLVALIFFIGRSFARLAAKYNKKRWVYALLSFIILTLGIFIGSQMEMVIKRTMDENGFLYILSGFIRLPVGLLFSWGYYQLLEGKWKGASDPND